MPFFAKWRLRMSAHEIRADVAQKSAMGGELAFSVAAAPPFSMRLASQTGFSLLGATFSHGQDPQRTFEQESSLG
jgi:hypothetical protein